MPVPHPPPDPSRTALVLGSSFLGVYAHAGLLNGLHQAGFTPAHIAGASAGALAGALFSSGLRGDALRDAALSSRLRLSFADVSAVFRLPGILTTTYSSGLFHGRGTVRHLRDLLGPRDLAEMDPPLDVAVTDFDDPSARILNRGPLAERVMASCAVPALFGVQQVGDRRYLDGGIACELPFEHLLDDPALDTIVIHRIRHRRSGPRVPWLTVSHAIGTAHHAACNELHRLRAKLAAAHGKRLVEIDTLTPFPGLFTNRRAPECYRLGEEAARRLLDPATPVRQHEPYGE